MSLTTRMCLVTWSLCAIVLCFSDLSFGSVALPTKNSLENAFLKLQKLADPTLKDNKDTNQLPCTCAVFLNGQFTKGSPDPPKGNPALLYEQDSIFPCSAQGNKQCTNRCLETVIMKYKKLHLFDF